MRRFLRFVAQLLVLIIVALAAARRDSPNGLAYGGAAGAEMPRRPYPAIPPPAPGVRPRAPFPAPPGCWGAAPLS